MQQTNNPLNPLTLQVFQQLDSSNYNHIPVTFVEQPKEFRKINNMESKLIQQLTPHKVKGKRAEKECRICLENQLQGKIISPCKCTGSVRYTHEKCLMEWIKRKIDINHKIKARCQLCDSQFNYRVTHCRTFDCNELQKNYQKQKSSIRCFAVVYGFFIILLLGIIGLLIACNSGAMDGKLKAYVVPNSTTMVIFVTAIIIFIIVLLVVAVLFISEYVVRQDLQIAQVNNYIQPAPFLKNYKIYFKK